MTLAVPPRRLESGAALAFLRSQPGAGNASHVGLGGRVFGSVAAALAEQLRAAAVEPLAMALLHPARPVLDTWAVAVDAPQAVMREHGCVRYATDGRWLHGCAKVNESAFEGGLEAATRAAYADLFAVLAASACPQLLRLWNHFADMNCETGGVERYRQFNAGRQQAFTKAGRSAFDGAPAACALGTAAGPLRVYFLAGTKPPLAIENPRQVSAYRYPDRYGPRSPTFSRAALIDAGDGRQALFISGTASIIGHETVHVGDVRRQTEESLVNIGAVLGAAAAGAGGPIDVHGLTCTVYLRHAADLPVVREVFERHVGADSPAARDAVYLHADICRADLLVEIEAHGFVPHRSPS